MIFKHAVYIQVFWTLILASTLLGFGRNDAPATHSSIWLAPADTNEKIVNILRTDRLSRSVVNGEPIQVLQGNVMLNQPDGDDTLYLWADRVTKYELRDEVLLIGDVLIVQNNDSLSADSVRYFSTPKKGIANGNVRLSDGEVQVFAPAALHFFDEKHTIFDHNVRLVDSATVLTSLDGEYFSEEKRAEFYGNVVLEEDNTYLEADSVTYYRETEVSLGYGNVFIERIGGDEEGAESDSTTRTFLFGHHVYNENKSGYSRMEGNALLFQLRQDTTGAETDSLIMTAHSMEAIRDDSLQRLIAVDSVQIWREDFSALADSAVYDRITLKNKPLREENRLYRNPMAWFDSYQLTGDTLRATAFEGHIDSLYVLGNAFAADEDSTTMRINQLKGKNLVGLFEQDSLKSLTVGPQAQAIYFKLGNDDQLGGIKTSGDRIALRFKNNDLDEIGVYSGIEGDYYDGALIPDPFQLDGFSWQPEKRPTKVRMLQNETRLHRIMERITPVEIPVVTESPLSLSDDQ